MKKVILITIAVMMFMFCNSVGNHYSRLDKVSDYRIHDVKDIVSRYQVNDVSSFYNKLTFLTAIEIKSYRCQ